MKSASQTLLLILAALIIVYDVSLGCASCGSGSDDALILFPNESLKLYAAFNRNYDFHNVDSDGDEVSAGGIEKRDALRFAIGKSLGIRSFVTFGLGQITNHGNSQSRTGWTDFSLGARFNLILPSISEPFIPQLQLVLGYKPGRTRSVHGTRNIDLLDNYGSGFDEYRMGIDFWYGLERFKFGGAYLLTKHEGKKYLQPGDTHRFTISSGYHWMTQYKTTVGVNRTFDAPKYYSGNRLPASSQRNQSVFANQDWQISDFDLIRLSWSKLAAFGKNQNTGRYSNVGLAYMRTL